MAVYYFQRRGWRLRRADANVANLLMVVEGLLIWMAYLSLSFGKPLLFAEAQDRVAARRSRCRTSPSAGRSRPRRRGRASCFPASTSTSTGRSRSPGTPTRWRRPIWSASAFLVVVALLSRLRPAPAAARPTRCTASPSSRSRCFFPAKYVPLLSFPRFALAAFPVFVALALFTRDRPRAHAAIVVAMLVALAALTARFALFEWVA